MADAVVVPCDQPHANEEYASFSIRERASLIWVEECETLFEEYAGLVFERSRTSTASSRSARVDACDACSRARAVADSTSVRGPRVAPDLLVSCVTFRRQEPRK
jgi:hypothetical protein